MNRVENGHTANNEESNGKKVYYQSLGCKVNSYETDAIRSLFESRGFVTVEEPKECDVYVINTCTVTAEAERKSGQMLRKARKLAPRAIVAAMGCRTEMRGGKDCADVCVGTKNRAALVDRVVRQLAGSQTSLENAANHRDALPESSGLCADRFSELPEPLNAFEEFGSVISREGTRAFVKIQDGCDSFCSYCIIPYARSHARSRQQQDTIREVRRLGEAGYREIVYTGINLGSYGAEWGSASESLQRLLEETIQIESIQRIRLGSIEPNLVDERFASALAASQKFCRHLHISLQSGSDSVLKRMNRKYGTAQFSHAVSILRAAVPDISLTTDIIVGFPAETDSEHLDSLRFCRTLGFSRIHVFPFSARNGTAASTMQPQVDPGVRNQRTADFLCLSDELAARSSAQMIGKTVCVLVESKRSGGESVGYSREYQRVRFISVQEEEPGRECMVRITGFEKDELVGEELRSGSF